MLASLISGGVASKNIIILVLIFSGVTFYFVKKCLLYRVSPEVHQNQPRRLPDFTVID